MMKKKMLYKHSNKLVLSVSTVKWIRFNTLSDDIEFAFGSVAIYATLPGILMISFAAAAVKFTECEPSSV